jgi:predicted DNA-binding transcriptional regulator AlpA
MIASVPKTLTVAKVADWLGVSTSTVRKMNSDGRLPKPVAVSEFERTAYFDSNGRKCSKAASVSQKTEQVSRLRWKLEHLETWLDCDCPNQKTFEGIKDQLAKRK